MTYRLLEKKYSYGIPATINDNMKMKILVRLLRRNQYGTW